MAQEITVGIKKLIEEANAAIETLTVEQAIALHGRDDITFDDLNADGHAPMAWSPRATQFLSAATNCPENTLRLPFSISLRMSTSVTCGIGRLPTREGISSST